jgi:hypothetical protein
MTLQELNSQLQQRPVDKERFAPWVKELSSINLEFPLTYPKRDDVIMPQWAIEVSLSLSVMHPRHPGSCGCEPGLLVRMVCVLVCATAAWLNPAVPLGQVSLVKWFFVV